AADADDDGVPNVWEFAWSRGAAAEHVPARSDLTPKMEPGGDGPRFVWEIPILTDKDLRLETTDRFDSEWTVLPHIETPLIIRLPHRNPDNRSSRLDAHHLPARLGSGFVPVFPPCPGQRA